MASGMASPTTRRCGARSRCRPRARHDQPQPGGRLRDARRAGEVVGEGFHAYAGGPHAEVVALAAGRRAGPRRHRGRHPGALRPHRPHRPLHPGADRRRRRPGRRRRCADPEPGRRGRRRTLRAAGVEVEIGVREAEAEAGNIAWLTSGAPGTGPYVIWKFAATLDGRSAAADGTSGGSPRRGRPGRRARAALRTVDAIMVGVGTVLADDPQLTARDLRDGTLATGSRCGSWSTAPGVPRPTPGSATAPRRPGSPPRPRSAPARTAGSTCARCSRRCTSAACRAVLLEGGPTLAGAFLRAGLVDEVVGYVAPKLLGAGPAALADAGVTTIAEAIDLELTDVTRVGPDLRLTACATQEGGLTDVHRHRGGARRGRRPRLATGDDRPDRRPRPDRSTTDARARRLDRGQRRLPDRRRRRRRRVHRRRDGRDAATALARRARAGDPVNLERAAPSATRLGGHLVQGHVDGVGPDRRPGARRALGRRAVRAARRRSPGTSWRRARSPSTASR